MANRTMKGLAVRCALAVAGALMAAPVAAQTDAADSSARSMGFRVGFFGNYQLMQYDGTIGSVPTVATCADGFGEASGSGFTAGGLFEISPVQKLALQARLGYSSFDAHFSTMEDIGNVVENGEVISAFSEHTIDVEFGLVTLGLRAVWEPFSFPLALNLGVEGGIVTSKDADQVETLVTPTGMTFWGGVTQRNHYMGELIGAAGFQMHGVFGLSYELPLSAYVTLSPEVSYHRAFSQVMEDSAWSAHALRLGAALKLRLNEVEPVPPPPPVPVLSAEVRANGVLADGTERAVPELRVEEFLSSQLRPLLNYVFFDENSSQMPERYVRMSSAQTRSFREDDLRDLDVLPTYYQMLNVLGRRMRENPGASITLVGSNAGGGGEKGDLNLARARAERVRDYLREIWGVDEGRMKVDARNLPEKPSNASQPEGQAENRRVEIIPQPETLLDPVFTSDTTRSTNPPVIRFHQNVQAEAGVSRWKLTVMQDGETLKEFSGSGPVPAGIDWSLQQQSDIPRGTAPIEYSMEVVDAAGQTRTTPVARLPIDQVTIQKKRRERIADKEIDRYSLILFDFGKTTIDAGNRRIIDFIQGRIGTGANVMVTGHSDRVGDADVNLRLSTERAKVAARELKVPPANVRGVGESVLLYDNDLPEGRLYSRVVNVVVETPINE